MGAKAVRGKSDRSFRAWNVSPQDRSSVDEFVSYAQKAMRLSDWSIRVDWSSPCEKGALATTQDMPDSKHAVLKFSEKFLQLSPRERRQVICHELCIATCSRFSASRKKLWQVLFQSRRLQYLVSPSLPQLSYLLTPWRMCLLKLSRQNQIRVEC